MTKDLIQDAPPSGDRPTAYDQAHVRLYLRLLDADAEGADWREAVDILFKIDVETEPDRAHQVYTAHLARARWLARNGYLKLLSTRNS